jgi:hypothetical protein
LLSQKPHHDRLRCPTYIVIQRIEDVKHTVEPKEWDIHHGDVPGITPPAHCLRGVCENPPRWATPWNIQAGQQNEPNTVGDLLVGADRLVMLVDFGERNLPANLSFSLHMG